MGEETGRGRHALDPSHHEKFAEEVRDICDELADVLISKNESYGNSALDPLRIFSKASVIEQLRVRVDDKLSRIFRGAEYQDEDTVLDLTGYLVLLLIAERKEQK